MRNRSPELGAIPGLPEKFSKEKSLSVFRKMCFTRAFEFQVKKIYDQGLIKFPIYLAAGQESISAALSEALDSPAIFAQHRCHDIYLSFGGDPVALVDELLGRPSGCAHGMGGSASIHSPAIGMYGHSGLMGDQIPIATGFALGTGRQTLAIMGDASAEEDYVLGALGYGAHKKLPILFVCIDNNLSILTEVKIRRNWEMTDVAQAFGMPSLAIADDPWLVMHHVSELKNKLPALLNIHTARELWHSGTGTDSEPEWNRFELVKNRLRELGLERETSEIEKNVQAKVENIWTERLNTEVSPATKTTI